jgi:hypothetical protein
MTPWLKITFDPRAAGVAHVRKSGRKRLVSTPGRWIVFDKADESAPPVFNAATFEECCRYIEEREGRGNI